MVICFFLNNLTTVWGDRKKISNSSVLSSVFSVLPIQWNGHLFLKCCPICDDSTLFLICICKLVSRAQSKIFKQTFLFVFKPRKYFGFQTQIFKPEKWHFLVYFNRPNISNLGSFSPSWQFFAAHTWHQKYSRLR